MTNRVRWTALSTLLAAAVGGCGNMDQTAAIPPGSATVGPAAPRAEQHYTAAFGGSATTGLRPHWTFTVTFDAQGASAGVEVPRLRVSLYNDELTIPTTAELGLDAGAAGATVVLEHETSCAQGGGCGLGFKVRIERTDADPSDVTVAWTGTIRAQMSGELGDTGPGDLVVTAD